MYSRLFFQTIRQTLVFHELTIVVLVWYHQVATLAVFLACLLWARLGR